MCQEQMEARLEALEQQVARLLAENVRLQDRVKGLTDQLEVARRAGKRQAAPFAKGEPAPKPARPGRKSGPAHGKAARREPPAQIDETYTGSTSTTWFPHVVCMS